MEKYENDKHNKLYLKLNSEIEKANWNMLTERNSVEIMVYINDDLDICDVGVQMATDNVVQIKEWLGNQSIQRPSEEMQKAWSNEEEEEGKEFNFIVIQPYLVIQDYKEIEKINLEEDSENPENMQ